MIVWICTDMEGLAGVDSWDQCYDPDDASPVYLYGRDQLTADTNAAIAGCFDAGATAVRVLDGHGRNGNKGFTADLDPRAQKVWIASIAPLRFEGLDEEVHAVAMIGQHAYAGTINGFLDHTQVPKELCRYQVNEHDAGEMSQFAIYAGSFGVPLAYVSGDEALCAEAQRLFPHALSTPTKRGTGWATCELYPTDAVRTAIRQDIAKALHSITPKEAYQPATPLSIRAEWSYSAHADRMGSVRGVQREDARTVSWTITDPRDIYNWPSSRWSPQ